MTSTIKTDSSNAPIVGTVETKIATANCSSYVNRVVRVGNVVHLNLQISFATAIGSGNFALIPEGFRPSDSVSVPIVWRNSSGVVHASYATISTGGYISQQIGSNTSAIIISGMYTV